MAGKDDWFFDPDETDNGYFYDDIEEYDLEYDQPDDGDTMAECASAQDAYTLSMRNRSCIDMNYMCKISGLSQEELEEELAYKVMWRSPEIFEETGDLSGCWVTKEQYLKGNLYKKLIKAKQLEQKTGLFYETICLLKDNLPDVVDFEDIRINLGATWVPIQFVTQFVAWLLKTYIPPTIEYDAFQGKWSIQCPASPDYVANYYTYGTKRMSALMIIKHILNATPVKVYDQVTRADRSGEDRVLNKADTLEAQEKLSAIQEMWQEFIRSDKRLEEKLQEEFMDHYGYTVSHYNGSYLELSDMNPAIQLYDHQKNAIARIVMNHNTLLAHEVGSGKTPEYMCGVHELLRMKLGTRAMLVVPNTTLEAVAQTYQMLYPQDKLLVVYPKKDFVPAERVKILNQIRSGEYQVIIMAYSSFDMIDMSHEYEMQQMYARIRECRAHIQSAASYAAKHSLETKLKQLLKASQKLDQDYVYKETDCYESLGIDILVVDEAHNYKNITLDNRMDSIVGVHNKGSKKADSMLKKVRYIQEQNGHVIFATGTPLTNSLADLYVLQSYLQPEEMKLCRIEHFSDWVNTFCEQTHSFEVDLDSKNYRFVTRFSKFHNLPELMSMFSDVCDFYQIEAGKLGLPDFAGYTDSVVKMSDAQREYIDELAERTEMIRTHQVRRKEDNLLKVTVDGRKCSLDVRLVDPEAQIGGDDNKCKVCAREMADNYHEHPGTTQIAFADISTPKEDFNVYDELKKNLVLNGVKEEEIAYIHDAVNEAKRNQIEKDFNSGKIRILIGSTQKLGTGSNVQERLYAVHHLDVPWRPADMVQREGRIIRQGNTNPEVRIYRYVTEASFDSYIWQLLENKQKFIAQFLSGSLSSLHREETDCADTVLNYAEIKALAIGNPLIKERVETANELEHARINQRQKRKELLALQEILQSIPGKLRQRQDLIHYTTADIKSYTHSKCSIPKAEREMFGEELLEALAGNYRKEEESVFDIYQGFEVVLPAWMDPNRPYVILRRRGSSSYMVKMDSDKALGCSKRLDYVLDHLEDTKAEHEREYQALLGQQRQIEETLDEGNTYDEEVRNLMERLKEIDRQLQEGHS